jgi:hypothetical protein
VRSEKKVYATPQLTQHGLLVQLTLANYPVGPSQVATDPKPSSVPIYGPSVPGTDGAIAGAPPPEDTISPPEGGISSSPAPISDPSVPGTDGAIAGAPLLKDAPATGVGDTPAAPKDDPATGVGDTPAAPKDDPATGVGDTLAAPKDDPATGAGDNPAPGSISSSPAPINGPSVPDRDSSEVVDPSKGNDPSPNKGGNPAGAGESASGLAPDGGTKDSGPAPDGGTKDTAPKTETKDSGPAPKAQEKNAEKQDAPQSAAALPVMGGAALPGILLIWRRLWRRPESK